jgi:capsular exopolysaccharide synthesis family protein
MDYIREALDKANVSLDKGRPAAMVHSISQAPSPLPLAPAPKSAAVPPAPPSAWTARQVSLDPRHLERNRIVSFSMDDPGHVPFNLLRTRVRTAMGSNNWKSIGVTSPTPGCGKTMVSLNLAMSLARGEGLKTVLIDLDLKRPSVAPTIGVNGGSSIGAFLSGEGAIGDCFVQVSQGLTIGLGGKHVRESSELLQSPRAQEMLDFIYGTLQPDVVVFDLPPMAVSDDVLAFLPRIDATLLVAAAGQSKITEIDTCEQQISQHGHFMGVVLNKAEIETKDYYY